MSSKEDIIKLVKEVKDFNEVFKTFLDGGFGVTKHFSEKLSFSDKFDYPDVYNMLFGFYLFVKLWHEI